MSSPNTKIKKDALIDALKKTLGNVSTACKGVGISRNSFYLWMKEDKKFEESVNDIKENNIDFAESKLLQKIADGDTTCIIFYLKTQGHNRGYIERREQTIITQMEPVIFTLPDGTKIEM